MDGDVRVLTTFRQRPRGKTEKKLGNWGTPEYPYSSYQISRAKCRKTSKFSWKWKNAENWWQFFIEDTWHHVHVKKNRLQISIMERQNVRKHCWNGLYQ